MNTNEAKDAIFSAWHEQAEILLPEFGFRRTRGGNWKDSTGRKVTGETGAAGKVYYYANAPFALKDYTRGRAFSLLKYVMQREGIADMNAALQYMAAQAGLKYERFRSVHDQQQYEAYILRAELLETANAFYIDSLVYKGSEHANSAAAARLRKYLEDRGYKRPDLRPPAAEYSGEARYMEIGFFPSYDALREHLEQAGYASDLIIDTIGRALPEAVGRTHRLTFPFRTPAGHIAGFAYRCTEDSPAKYLYDTGLKKSELLYGLRTAGKFTKDGLTVVEGLLDAAIAYARGIDGVVAIGGADISEQQARLILKHSGGVVRLCLDQDEAGRAGTASGIDRLLHTSKAEGIARFRAYVCTLPAGVKDPDELITKQGADAFREVIAYAIREYEYIQNETAAKYNARLKPIGLNGELMYTAQDQDALVAEVMLTAAKLTNGLDESAFLSHFRQAYKGVFTQEAIDAAVAAIKRDEEQRKQAAELQQLVYDAQRELKKGTAPADILTTAKQSIEKIEGLRAADLLTFESYEELEASALISSESMRTGYADLDRGFRYPAGGTTLIAGRTSHGKTAFMLNSILRQAQMPEYAGLKFYFFSYEEAKKKLFVKMLNSLINRNIADALGGSSYKGLNNEEALIKYMLHLQAKRVRPEDFIEEKRELLRDLVNSGRLVITDRRYTVEELKTVIHAAAKGSVYGTAYIDYVQRIKAAKEFRERRAEVDYISAELCEIAKNTDRPLIIGAQLNRTAAQTGKAYEDKRPRLEHLKESGGLEEDANSVLTIYNEQAERIEDGYKDAPHVLANLEVQAPKNRDGKRNHKTVLLFNQSTRNIENMTREEVKKYFKDLKDQQDQQRRRKKQEQKQGGEIQPNAAEPIIETILENPYTYDHKPF